MATAQLNLAAFKASIKARLRPTADKMNRIADAANLQIKNRFDTGGASGGTVWPPGVFPAIAKTPPLSGLQYSFVPRGEEGTASVTSEGHWAATHQQGCISRGGVLPDIKPVKAKALYVPVTPLGQKAYEDHKNRALVIESPIFAGGMATMSKPKFSGNTFSGNAKYGIDYLLLQKVSIPPRPMLPTSDSERADLARQAIKILASQ